MSILLNIRFYSVKCKKCGSKFTASTKDNCNSCNYLGINCVHRTVCLRCYRDLVLRDRVFFSAMGVIVLVLSHVLGGRII